MQPTWIILYFSFQPYAKRYDPNYKYEQWRRNIVLRDLPVKTNSQNVIDALSTFGSVADVKVTPSGKLFYRYLYLYSFSYFLLL